MARKRRTGRLLGFDYKGDLARIIHVEDATEEHVKKEHERRLWLLFKELKVTPGNWEALAYTLALWHVPGFQVDWIDPKRRGGRPSKRVQREGEALALAKEVDRIIAEAKASTANHRRRTVKGACEYLASSPDNQRWHCRESDQATRARWITHLQKQVSLGRRLMKDKAGQ